MPHPIDEFRGYYEFLSNFHTEPDGTTVEHEYQAAKALHEGEAEWVMNAPTPGEAKRRGRQVTLVPMWEEIKLEVMRELIRKKFQDHPTLAEKLKKTGDLMLIEGNWWGDTFWGISGGRGENWLGKILMEVREEL